MLWYTFHAILLSSKQLHFCLIHFFNMYVRSLERSFVLLSIQNFIISICVASVSPLPNITTTISCGSVTYEYVIKNLKEVWSLPQAVPQLCAKECALRSSCHSWHHDGHQTCFLHKSDPRPVNAGILGPHAQRFQFGLQSEYVSIFI